jgi:hypothetical protein
MVTGVSEEPTDFIFTVIYFNFITSIEWVQEAISPGVQRQEREADLPSIA